MKRQKGQPNDVVATTNHRAAQTIPTLAPPITRTLLNLILSASGTPNDMIFFDIGDVPLIL